MNNVAYASNSGVFTRRDAIQFAWDSDLSGPIDRGGTVDPALTTSLFAGLSPRECSEIIASAATRTFSRGEVLFFQGQDVHHLVLIKSGRVKLTQVSSDGSEVILWVLGSGEVMGIHADTEGCIHSCAGRAMERCRALVWERERLKLILTHHPQIKVNMVRIQDARLGELEERFSEIASESIANRLALLLLRLGKSIGIQGSGGIELDFRQQELAQMTGTTHCTVNRILSKWVALGIVVPGRKGIIIPDPALLAANICGKGLRRPIVVPHSNAPALQKMAS
jgi:CRP-like cAMP-binding protein